MKPKLSHAAPGRVRKPWRLPASSEPGPTAKPDPLSRRLRQRAGLERSRPAGDSAQLSASAREARFLSILRLVPRGFHACRPLQSLEPQPHAAARERRGHAEFAQRRLPSQRHHAGRSAAGKSAFMPPWGNTLRQDDIEAVIAFYRAIAQPPYQPPARPGPQYSVR